MSLLSFVGKGDGKMTSSIEYTVNCLHEYGKRSSALVAQGETKALPFGIAPNAGEICDIDLRAGDAWHVDIWLKQGLDLLRAVEDLDAGYRSAIKQKKTKLSSEIARGIHNLYETWYAKAIAMLPTIDTFEKNQFSLDNAKEFRKACSRGFMPGLDRQSVSSSAKTSGKGLREIANAIRGGAIRVRRRKSGRR